jgi:hypothetical protein
MSFGQMGYLYWHKADYAAARGALTEELALLRRLEASSFTMNFCLIGFAAVAISEGHLVRGTQLLGAIEAESQRTGRTPKDMFRIVQEKTQAAAKAQLQTGDFDAAWSSGCALTMSQAAELARAV